MTHSLIFFSLFILSFTLSCSERQHLPKAPTKREGKVPSAFRKSEYQRDLGRFATERTGRSGVLMKSYALRGAFDWKKQELEATVEITFRLLCSCQDSFVLDSRVEEIRSILLKDTGQFLGSSISNGRDLAVDLSQVPEPIRKKDLTVVIAYRARANIRNNGEPSSLVAVDGIMGDPIKSKMVYTHAEPQDASVWMPCVNDPASRALFSIEMKMPASQMLISNGDLVKNEVEDDFRWVKYQTRYTLPVYLMAFAQGEMTVATEYHQHLPVSIVTRHGIRADVHGLLKETIRQIKYYENLLVPYPFEKYMLVLVPEFVSGGIEHAGITFVDETSNSQSQLSRDLGLMAHELAHQWFGDLVTVSSWDDLWIKEGMATLLGEESMRPYEDPKNSGRLMGHEFSVSQGAAIFDSSLKPEQKYTDGPYGRAAWLLTQIRSILGEEVFWKTLKKLLTDYRFQSIGTNDFLGYFKAVGGEALFQKVMRAIKAKDIPKFNLEQKNGVFTVSLEDQEGSLLIPLEWAWHSDSGSVENEVFTETTSLSHLVNDVRLLILDPQDRHPVETFGNWEPLSEIIDPLMVPRTDPQFQRYFLQSGHVHQRALTDNGKWKLTPSQLGTVYESLNSEFAKYEFLKKICTLAKEETNVSLLGLWKNEIHKKFLNPPFLGVPIRTTDPLLGACRSFVSSELFESLWQNIQSNPQSVERSDLQFYFASLIPENSAKQAFQLWSNVSAFGPTVRSRIVGLQNLIRHLKGSKDYEKPSDQELPDWKGHLLYLLQNNRTEKFLAVLLPEIRRLKILEAAPELAKIMRSAASEAWESAYCTAQEIGSQNIATKKAFEDALGDPKTLPKSLQDLINNSISCTEEE